MYIFVHVRNKCLETCTGANCLRYFLIILLFSLVSKHLLVYYVISRPTVIYVCTRYLFYSSLQTFILFEISFFGNT